MIIGGNNNNYNFVHCECALQAVISLLKVQRPSYMFYISKHNFFKSLRMFSRIKTSHWYV